MVVREWYDEDNGTTYCIRFIKINDMWWAVLKDICFALNLDVWHVSQRIDADFLLKHNVPDDNPLLRGSHSKRHTNGYIMTLVNEMGIYQCISGSRKVEARKFNKWYPQMISKLRKGIGLEEYMAFDMMDEKVQKHVDEQLDKVLPEFSPFLDNIFFDEETGIVMQSVTLPGGDVEQIPYEGEIPYPYNLYSFK